VASARLAPTRPGTAPSGPVSYQLDVDQQLGHARGPTLARLIGDRFQFAQQVRAAQRVGGALKAPVRRPAVVHRHAGEPGSTPAAFIACCPA
jgi:hypothetical protein